MAKGKNYVIRRCEEGYDRLAASYAVRRANPTGRKVSDQYRFAKTARQNAERFREEAEAKRVVKSIKRVNPQTELAVVEL